MEKIINKHFCVQPFINVTTRITGYHNVCCNTSFKDSNIKKHTSYDFFNSDKVKKMRNDLLNGKRLADCRVCQYQEKIGHHSHRQKYNEYYYIKNEQSSDYYKNIVEKLHINTLQRPLYVDIHIGNLCNLKCLTCNEKDSSMFHAENKILGISEAPNTDYTKFVIDTADAIKEIIHPKLLFLDVRGGETLMVPEIKKVLSTIPNDIAKNITLKIQTNGTTFPDKTWVSIFKKFKNTKVNVSMDAYENDNTYIRYPSNWQKILNTIEYLEQQNIKFIINTVVSNLNILKLDKLLNWIKEKKYLNYFYMLDTPSHYRPTNLPKQVLELAGKRLSNISKDFANKDMAKAIDQLIDICYNTNDFNIKNWQIFCKEINMRDKHRNNNILNTLPELKRFLLK
jgi:MoaA/NifB/PqqE/SkfB family radical SAM enzyme